MGFSKEVVEDALVACQRSCCICNKLCGTRIETHHIKPKHKGGDDSPENCIPLCFDCHAEVGHYNDTHPRGRKYSEGELRKHRDNWYRKIKGLKTPEASPDNPEQAIQLVKGHSNMVAGRDLNIRTERIVTRPIVQIDPGGKHISNSTARKIQELVKEYINIHSIAGKQPGQAAQRIWSSLKNKFNVTSYKEISNDDSDEAVQWLRIQIARARPKIRRKDPEKWKQSLYGSIYARARELEISKEDLYILAQDRLPLKKPISSLKELTQKNLQRLYHIMIYEFNKYQSGRSD